MPPYIAVKLESSNAVLPTKAHSDDVGYDVTLISEVERLSSKTAMYDTGIIVAPLSMNTYVELVPRSSLHKLGYVLANSVGIIDPNYRGTLKVVLTKVDDDLPDITLPFKCVQMIVRNLELSEIIQIERLDSNTKRGNGGFGSSGF